MPELITSRQAIASVLRSEMRADPDMIVIGEIVATSGGIVRVTTGLIDEFGPDRVVETPISENILVGAGLGGALAGRHMVVEVFAADMLFTAGSEVINDIAKWRYQHRWEDPIHLVLRMPMGIGQPFAGPEHSQCIEGYLMRTAGLTVVAPGTVLDAAGLLRSAIRLGDPVVFLEHRRLYDVEAPVSAENLGAAEVPIGQATVVRPGDALTIVAWSWMRLLAEKAADELSAEGIEAEIIDPRTIKPLDMPAIIASVARTGSLLVVEEAPRTGCVGGSIIADVVREVDLGRGHADTLTMPDVPLPFDQGLADALVPSVSQIVETASRMVSESPVVVRR
jgi:pyruvate/2-oxoglutarate/acetoin dehydrogenase E1 component